MHRTGIFHVPLHFPAAFLLSAGMSLFSLIAAEATANGQLQKQTTIYQQGDVILFGNTLGQACGPNPASPLTGSIDNSCRTAAPMSPGIQALWHVDASAAVADPSISPADASSEACFSLPQGAIITHARLYWASIVGTAGNTVTFSHIPATGTQVELVKIDPLKIQYLDAADQRLSNKKIYLRSVDVASELRRLGAGCYRLGGIDIPADYATTPYSFAGWAVAVAYRHASKASSVLVIDDGLVQSTPSPPPLCQRALSSATGTPQVQVLGLGADPLQGCKNPPMGPFSARSDDRLAVNQGFVPSVGMPPMPTPNFLDSSLRTTDPAISKNRPQWKVDTAGSMSGITLRSVAGPLSAPMKIEVSDQSRRCGEKKPNDPPGENDDYPFVGVIAVSLAANNPSFETTTLRADPLACSHQAKLTLSLSNAGPVLAQQVMASIPLPQGLTPVSNSINTKWSGTPPSDSIMASWNAAESTILLTVPQFPAGNTTLELSFLVEGSPGSQYNVQATVKADNASPLQISWLSGPSTDKPGETTPVQLAAGGGANASSCNPSPDAGSSEQGLSGGGTGSPYGCSMAAQTGIPLMLVPLAMACLALFRRLRRRAAAAGGQADSKSPFKVWR